MKTCASSGIQTHDLLITTYLLYYLSYKGVQFRTSKAKERQKMITTVYSGPGVNSVNNQILQNHNLIDEIWTQSWLIIWSVWFVTIRQEGRTEL